MNTKKELRELLKKVKNTRTALGKIDGGYKIFTSTLKEKLGKDSGYSDQNLHYLKRDLNNLLDSLDNKDTLKMEQIEEKPYIVTLRKYIEDGNEFLKELEAKLISNTTWHIYYFNVHNKGNLKEALLGHGYLKTKENSHCAFETFETDEYSEKTIYEGRYNLFSDDKMLNFNLNSGASKAVSIMLSMVSKGDYQIGTYCWTDDLRMKAGTLIATHIKDESRKGTVDNKQDLALTYLQERTNSYLEAKQPIKKTNSKDYFPYYDLEERFIDSPSPRIILSYAEKEYDRSRDDSEEYKPGRICESINQYLRSRFDVTKHGLGNEDLFGSREDFNIKSPHPILEFTTIKFGSELIWSRMEHLKGSRFYITFLEDLPIMFMELAWAIVFSKHCLIIYKKGSLVPILQKFLRASKGWKKYSNEVSISLIEFENLNKEEEQVRNDILVWIMDNTYILAEDFN
ncbi:MAG: hypothetical protein AAGA64_12300 [Bacteroidota bacterium]